MPKAVRSRERSGPTSTQRSSRAESDAPAPKVSEKDQDRWLELQDAFESAKGQRARQKADQIVEQAAVILRRAGVHYQRLTLQGLPAIRILPESKGSALNQAANELKALDGIALMYSPELVKGFSAVFNADAHTLLLPDEAMFHAVPEFAYEHEKTHAEEWFHTQKGEPTLWGAVHATALGKTVLTPERPRDPYAKHFYFDEVEAYSTGVLKGIDWLSEHPGDVWKVAGDAEQGVSVSREAAQAASLILKSIRSKRADVVLEQVPSQLRDKQAPALSSVTLRAPGVELQMVLNGVETTDDAVVERAVVDRLERVKSATAIVTRDLGRIQKLLDEARLDDDGNLSQGTLRKANALAEKTRDAIEDSERSL
jgi:hypothetical protein